MSAITGLLLCGIFLIKEDTKEAFVSDVSNTAPIPIVITFLKFMGATPPDMPDCMGELEIYARMGIVLAVPEGSIDAYKKGIWGRYFRIMEQ